MWSSIICSVHHILLGRSNQGCDGHVRRIRETTNKSTVLVGKPKGKKLFGRRRGRQRDKIKMNLRAIACGDIDWFYVTNLILVQA
jgi:hypothetical protein